MSEEYGLFTLMSRIDGMSNQFTKTDWKIVQYIKKNIKKFISLSAQELAKEIGTSDASIIRFSQKVGYSGLNELKYIMQKELDKEFSSANHSDFSTLLGDNKMLVDGLFSITNPNDIANLRQKMLDANRIFIIGLDFNSNIAEIIAHKFIMLGLTVGSLTTYDTLKLYQALSKPDDLFITISLSGNHRMLSTILGDLVKNGSNVVLISNYEKSLCASHSSLTLLIPKTDLLYSRNSISREILILQLFDIVFQSFLLEDMDSNQIFQKAASFARPDDDTRTPIARLTDYL